MTRKIKTPPVKNFPAEFLQPKGREGGGWGGSYSSVACLVNSHLTIDHPSPSRRSTGGIRHTTKMAASRYFHTGAAAAAAVDASFGVWAFPVAEMISLETRLNGWGLLSWVLPTHFTRYWDDTTKVVRCGVNVVLFHDTPQLRSVGCASGRIHSECSFIWLIYICSVRGSTHQAERELFFLLSVHQSILAKYVR